LYSTLKKLKIDDDTIVIFTSDNGTTWLRNQVDYEFFNSVGPLRGLKGSLYEGGVRVPLIARWPGKIKQNTVTNHISANYDLLSTIGEITACKCTAKDGISFLPVLLNQKNRQEKHPYLFWDFAGYGGQIAVRLGKWKGIKRNLVKCPDSPLELYDLETDIGEKYDLVLQYPDIASEIENIMIEARNVPKCEHFHFGKYSE
jgi:arylsulfatase A-like enzyme